MREHLLDRISINLSADVPPTFDDRVAAVDIATRFQVFKLLCVSTFVCEAYARPLYFAVAVEQVICQSLTQPGCSSCRILSGCSACCSADTWGKWFAGISVGRALRVERVRCKPFCLGSLQFERAYSVLRPEAASIMLGCLALPKACWCPHL